MPDTADVGLLGAVALLLVAGYILLAAVARGQYERIQKYGLFRVRDDLIYLVAVGKLNEDEAVFQILYRAANYWINRTDGINLRAMINARLEGLDPAEKAKVQEIHRALETKDEEVRRVVAGFYVAMLSILRENSLLLRLMIRARPLAMGIVALARFIAQHAMLERVRARGAVPVQAYEVYRDYETAPAAMAA